MADKIPANIDGEQPAALSHGEFVIPADVVSHLGNGNSEAGADKLYQMMARIRKARTGNDKQGKQINPDKFMPGGLATAYAGGGSVQGFNGATGSTVAATPTSAGGVPLDTSKTSTLSPWAGDYITNFLGQGAALANAPQQTYGGPLTAGASNLQQQGFAGISDVAGAGFQPTTFTSGTFGTAEANKYMNPYLTAALQPQIDEARRQSLITQQQNAAKMTQAGGFGGSRQAILDAETQRNLANTQANITGQGYSSAFNNAQQQFNADQQRKMQEAQYGAGFGLQGLQTGLQAAQAQGNLGNIANQASLSNLQQQLAGGAQERGITAEGVAADLAEFEKQRQYPYQQVQFQRDMISGLPTGSVQNTPGQMSGIGSLLSVLGGGTAAASALGYKNVGDLLTSLGLDLGQKTS
jgi:hypothetical protein